MKFIPDGIPARLIHAAPRIGLEIVAALLLLYIIQPIPARAPELPLVHISAQQMAKLEPSAKPSTLSKVVRPVAKLQERVVADGAGREMLDAFRAASEPADSSQIMLADIPSAGSDSSAATSDGPKIFPSRERLAYAYGWDITRARLQLFTFTSDDAKERLTYNVCGHVTGRMVGDSAVNQGSRLCWLPDVTLAAGAGFIGYGIAAKDPKSAAIGVGVLVLRKVVLRR